MGQLHQVHARCALNIAPTQVQFCKKNEQCRDRDMHMRMNPCMHACMCTHIDKHTAVHWQAYFSIQNLMTIKRDLMVVPASEKLTSSKTTLHPLTASVSTYFLFSNIFTQLRVIFHLQTQIFDQAQVFTFSFQVPKNSNTISFIQIH